MSQYYIRAQLLVAQNHPEKALDEIQHHLAEEPHDSQALALQGEILLRLKRRKESLESIHQAIALDPDSDFVHYTHSRILSELDNFKAAQSAINEAIRLQPDEASYYCQQAVIHLHRSQWQEMLDSANHALAIDPEDTNAINLQAQALKRLRQPNKAEASLKASFQRDPENPHTHASQGWLLLEQHQIEQALKHFKEALRLDPTFDWARIGILEALKARNIIYRSMLSFFFWMTNFSPRVRWMIILGAWVGINFLNRLDNPLGSFSFLVTPIVISYLVFVLMTWIANPLFNFLLRFDPYGRLALDRRQTQQANSLALCILLGIFFLTCLIFGIRHQYIVTALVGSFLLSIPVTSCFETRQGKYRVGMAIYSSALAAILLYYVAYGHFIVYPQSVRLQSELEQLKADYSEDEINEMLSTSTMRIFATEETAQEAGVDVDLAKKTSELKLNFIMLKEKQKRSDSLSTLFHVGIFISCFLPAFLPDAEDRNDVQVNLT